MNEYPNPRSVLVVDNCRIHHTDTLQDVLNDAGIMLLYLPPYSPDLNPIEESFSTWKAYLCCNGFTIQLAEDPMLVILDSCSCITGEMSARWFQHTGYMFQGTGSIVCNEVLIHWYGNTIGMDGNNKQ